MKNLVFNTIIVILLSLSIYFTLGGITILQNRLDGVITTVLAMAAFGLKHFTFKSSFSKDLEYNNVDHPTFSIFEEIKTKDLRNLDLGSEGRTEMFRVLLTEQIDAYAEHMRHFLTLRFNNCAEFRLRSRELILDILKLCEKKWKEKQIPDIVVSRYLTLHANRIDMLLNDIEALVFYRLDKASKGEFDEVTFYIFTHISIIIRLAVAEDSLNTLKGLNGSLNDLTFNNKSLKKS
jgi:hypothetical protein